MQIGDHIEITAGYSWADGLSPVLPPLSDILVLRLREALHIPVTVLYIPQLLLVSLRTRISLSGDSPDTGKSAQL